MASTDGEWIIIRAADNRQWGNETYPTKEDARRDLRSFWKGVSGVDLKKFEIVRAAEKPADVGLYVARMAAT